MRYVLAGNPNSGKTTLFNELTGSNFKVGNFSGVTVESKIATYKKDKNIELIDLPGSYSLSGVSPDEKELEKVLKGDKIDGIIFVLDSAKLTRSEVLLFELLSLNKPLTIAVNFSDELDKKDMLIKGEKLSKILGVKVEFISAKKGLNVHKLIGTVSSNTTIPKINDVKKAREKIKEISFSTIKDANALTEKIDAFLLGGFTGIVLLFLMLFTTFYLSTKIGGLIGNYLSLFFGFLLAEIEVALTNLSVPTFAVSLLVDGALNSFFSVLIFLPEILLMSLVMSIFDCTGYTARIAVLCDGIFRPFHLSGKTVVSLITSTSCIVSGVLATRIIESKTERLRAVLVTSFMPCSAKMVVMTYLATNIFSHPVLVMLILYATCFLAVAIVSLILDKFSVFGTVDGELFMELPTYRLPTLKSLFLSLKEKTLSFIKKAGTVIVAISIVFWVLENFSISFIYGGTPTILSLVSKGVSLITYPLGFYGEKTSLSLLFGIIAKESIISVTGSLSFSIFSSKFSAFSFVVFVLLYPPCVSALSVIYKEVKKGEFIKILAFQFLTAYSFSLVINLFGLLVLATSVKFIIFLIAFFLTIVCFFAFRIKKGSVKTRKIQRKILMSKKIQK